MNQIKKRDLAESVVARLIISTISALIVAVNLNSFVQAGDLFPGGFTGLTRLIMRCAWEFAGVELPFGPINIAINALPALFCLKYVGKRFTLWSCFVIVLTSIFTDLVPSFPITEDPLLVAVFGGLINGVSIGICLYVRITSGGTDFIAIPLMERWNVSTWNYILAGNVVMLLIAGALFAGNRPCTRLFSSLPRPRSYELWTRTAHRLRCSLSPDGKALAACVPRFRNCTILQPWLRVWDFTTASAVF